MSHARQQIKAAITTAVTGLATTGSYVFSDPLYPNDPDDLPAVRIEIIREDIQTDLDAMGGIETRELLVAIEAVGEKSSGLAAQLDQICLEAEIAISGSTTLAGLVLDGGLRSTEFELSGDGETPVGTARMEWYFHYQVNVANPATIL